MSPRLDLGPRPPLGYTASTLDRAAGRRSDSAALSSYLQDRRAGVYAVAGELVLLKDGKQTLDPLFAATEAEALGAVRETVFLGFAEDAPRFGFGFDASSAEPLRSRTDLKITDLRTIAVQGLIEAEHLPPLAEAKALIGWHARHRFCPNCGAPTEVAQGGWRRDCPACKVEHFPRTDPVVIMLALAGERCVLGRSPRFAPTMWSALAGFVEPGETIEEAVRREVLEETGIACGRVAYFASQPWPFPSSLMIGCHAEALSDGIVIDRNEIEDARWFERSELRSMLGRCHPAGLTAPPPVAIAYHLIRSFVEDGCAVLN